MNMADQPDGGANQELETANDEHPDGHPFIFWVQEQDAAQKKPDGNKEIVDDADHLIAAANDQLFMPQPEGQWVVGTVFNHVISCSCHVDVGNPLTPMPDVRPR